MTGQEFYELIKENVVILDGATGSNLQKAGMPFGVCPEQWIIEHPNILQDLQRSYVEAGSQIVYAPTFGANRFKLAEYGLSDQVEYMNKRLVNISREAVGYDVLVAGDLTMTGKLLKPLGTLSFEEMVDVYKEQVSVLVEAGVDLIVIETMMNLAETRAALIAVKEASSLAVMVTMSFEKNGKTIYGTDPQTAIEVLQSLGADAVGINCSAGPDYMLSILQQMEPQAKVPLITKPNAGVPKLRDGKTLYDMDVSTFSLHMKKLIEHGAVLIGGCCGTDPQYISAISKMEKRKSVSQIKHSSSFFLTTERNCFSIDQSSKIKTIDPLKDKDIVEEYQDGEYDSLIDIIEEYNDEGVDVICLSIEGKEGVTYIQNTLEEICSIIQIPLAFSSSNIDILQAALRCYPGRAGLIAKTTDISQLQILCQKYGAVLL